jgi:hypothetical protein
MAIKETNTIFGAIKQYHDEIIKPKINEIIENTANTDTENFEELSKGLAKELADREVAEHNLNVRVDEETLARVTRDIEITNYLNSEITRVIKKAENELKEGLSQEENKRIREDLLTREALVNEANLRLAEEERLYTRLDVEEDSRIKADEAVLERLRGEFDKAISAEVTRSTEAEETLQENINNQILELNSTLDSKFTKLIADEHSTRFEADTAEASLREEKDKELADAISNEYRRATEIETTLSTLLAAETVAREQMHTDLSTGLADESSERIKADNIISSQIDTEIANRITAYSTLEENLINKINTDIVALNSASKDELANEVAILNASIASKDALIEDKFKAVTNTVEKESQDRISADGALDVKIDNEISDRNTAIQELADNVGHNINQLGIVVYKTQQDLVDEGITRAQAISSIRTENELLMNGIKARLTDIENKSEASVAIVANHTDKLQEINLVIPSEASLGNKLADKAYVENLIASESSVFVGTYDSFEDIQKLTEVKNNSYAFHKTENSYDRYKYSGVDKA